MVVTELYPYMQIATFIGGIAGIWAMLSKKIGVLEEKVKHLEETKDDLNSVSRSVVRLEEQVKGMSNQFDELKQLLIKHYS